MRSSDGRAPLRVPSASALLRVARTAARAGGARTLEWFGRRITPEIKPDGSPVTPADRASEREIRRTILREFPAHAILGEEGGLTPGRAKVRWIIDPIDGTVSFIHGVPIYAVLVAAEVGGEPVAGVIHLPALDETIEAARGLGCRWNGRRAHVSPTRKLSEATVLTTSVRALESEGVPFRRVISRTGRQRGWGDAYGHALVATGRADAIIDTGLKRWDVAPLFPILHEAGGEITDWTGLAEPASENFVSSNGHVHRALLRLLRAR